MSEQIFAIAQAGEKLIKKMLPQPKHLTLYQLQSFFLHRHGVQLLSVSEEVYNAFDPEFMQFIDLTLDEHAIELIKDLKQMKKNQIKEEWEVLING